ncbi:hypothetical protein E1258_14985 [Micromonospora sp. KC207]|uniref:hypothetical protein n=1 Tax=Micromonospora sp. KC207 TaxID=2530377 RepID=UPI001047958A|nr:hypothetical protein [Micromonospora sp. KC207]TDC60342.1 hypothetical protein E1258_14985 [Micromonospora sp. KC207]
MTRMVDDLDAGSVAAVASLVVTSHAAGHTCWRCTPAGCEEVTWAREVLTLADTDWAALERLVATW